jgi:tetratricopeptide (TPR) repeat protein
MGQMTKSVFVLMPFRDEFDDVYLVIRDAVGAASQSLGITIRCLRADEIAKPGRITEQIIDHIQKADLLIADLSGNNPNVMYELGYGHALKRAAIIVNQDVHTSPFDVEDFRQVLYDRNRLMKDCRPSLVAAIRDVFGGESGVPSQVATVRAASGEVGSPDQGEVATAPLRPGDKLVAALQSSHLKLQYANAKNNTAEARRVADDVKELLSRVTVASGGDRSDIDNTAAIAGNCAVEMEKAELPDHAQTVYRRALGLFPDYAGLHLQYCDFLLDNDKHEEAQQELERAKGLERDAHDRRRIQHLEMKLSLKTGVHSREIAADVKEEFERRPSDHLAAAAYLLYLDRTGASLGEFEEVCAKWKEASPPGQKWRADRALADQFAGAEDPEHTSLDFHGGPGRSFELRKLFRIS